MLNYFIMGLVGVVFGFFLGRSMGKEKQITTEDAVNFLNKQGYWVRLNAGPKIRKN